MLSRHPFGRLLSSVAAFTVNDKDLELILGVAIRSERSETPLDRGRFVPTRDHNRNHWKLLRHYFLPHVSAYLASFATPSST
jgi:hypothetical protein